MLAVWRKGCVLVPLNCTYPLDELCYFIKDSEASLVLVSDTILFEKLRASIPTSTSIQCLTADSSNFNTPNYSECVAREKDDNALIIYTSGTTGKPKGVIHTFDSLWNQISVLNDAWKWSEKDRILHILPIHHIHGLVNALLCPLMVGASIEFYSEGSSDSGLLWSKLATDENLTVFMAVPTIYVRLINYYNTMDGHGKNNIPQISKRKTPFRLMVCGSASLLPTHFSQWKSITNYTLLERYGMTEIGMALSNPMEEDQRMPGVVGYPLKGVECKILPDENYNFEENTGSLLVKSPSMFKGYWKREEDTRKAFNSDGWFLTGDIASIDSSKGFYRILGRSSDIIKTGGYKVSAVEVEQAINTILSKRNMTEVKECSVLGLPDLEWGERVLAVLVLPDEQLVNKVRIINCIKEDCRASIAKQKVPTRFAVLPALPKNAMGKVNKKALLKILQEKDHVTILS